VELVKRKEKKKKEEELLVNCLWSVNKRKRVVCVQQLGRAGLLDYTHTATTHSQKGKKFCEQFSSSSSFRLVSLSLFFGVGLVVGWSLSVSLGSTLSAIGRGTTT
jgi:hypothetical protein